MAYAYAIAAAAAVLCLIVFLIIKNTLWFHIRNWLINNKLQPPDFSEHTKHYVRIIKKNPVPTELIREIQNEELHIPVNDKGCLVSTESFGRIKDQNWYDIAFAVAVEKDENGEFYLELRHRQGNTPVPVRLRLNTVYDLDDEQIQDGDRIQLIYTNIKVYGRN